MSNSSNNKKHQAYRQLALLMMVSLIGTAGIALPYPVLAPYFLNENNPLTTFAGVEPKLLLGMILATYPLGLLIGSLIIGALSDRFGRKPVLIQALLISVLGYLLTAIGFYWQNFLLVLMARLLTGLCEGNIATARAMALDLHPQVDRKRALALIYSTTYAGWLVGPLAGGYLVSFGVDTTFMIAALAVLMAYLIARRYLPYTRPQLKDSLSIWQQIRHEHSFGLLRQRPILQMAVYYFVYTLGINTYYEFYPLWLAEDHHFSSQAIGWATALMTIVMVLSSSSFVTWMARVFGDRNTLIGGSIGLAGCILVATQLGLPSLYVALALSGACIALVNTVYPSLMSQHFGHLGEGKVMGLQVSLFCLTNIIMALAGSWVTLMGSVYTMQLAALLILLSLLFFRRPESISTHQTAEETHAEMP